MSNVNVELWLDEEIESDFTKLSTMKAGSEERKLTIDELTKLMDRKIEIIRIENEREDRAAAREAEQLMKKQQLDDENKDRLTRNIISAVGIVLPVIVTIWGTRVCLKFEETGTVTTQMGRGFLQRLFPKK